MKPTLNISKLHEIMKEKEWDEKALADHMGVAHVTVYRVLRNQRGAGTEFIARLMNILQDTDFNELIIFDEVLPKGIEKEG